MTDDNKNPASVNTDRELFRESGHEAGDAYADSIFVTSGGGIGMNCGGYVICKPIRGWFECARTHPPAGGAVSDALREIVEACEEDCGVPVPEDGDDDPVAATQDQHGPIKGSALTFGILRRARSALSTPAASGTAHNLVDMFAAYGERQGCSRCGATDPVDLAKPCPAISDGRIYASTPPASAGSEDNEHLRKEAEGIIDLWIEEEDEGQEPNEAVTISTSISELSILKTALLPMRITTPANADALPQDVINLVIAAREVMDAGHTGEKFDALLYAAEAFSSRVPYENDPSEEGDNPSTGAFIAAVSRADELRNPTGLDAALNAVTANADEAGLRVLDAPSVKILERAITLAHNGPQFAHAGHCNASYDPRGACNCGADSANKKLLALAKIELRRVAQSPAVGDELQRERERLAQILEAEGMALSDVPVRVGYVLAANLVRRGRALTNAEKMNNLKRAIEDAEH